MHRRTIREVLNQLDDHELTALEIAALLGNSFRIRVGSGLGGHPLPTERLVPAR